MAKAVVLQPTGMRLDKGLYTVFFDAVVHDEKDWYVHLHVNASAATIKPIQSWQVLVRDAIVAQASTEMGVVVDEVMFPDFTVLPGA